MAAVSSDEKIILGGILGVFCPSFSKIFKINKNFLEFGNFDCFGVFGHGEHRYEGIESFWTEFDPLFGVLPSLEVRGTKRQGYPCIQSRLENLFTGVYLPKSNRLCGYYSSTDYFLNFLKKI